MQGFLLLQTSSDHPVLACVRRPSVDLEESLNENGGSHSSSHRLSEKLNQEFSKGNLPTQGLSFV